MLPEQVAEVGRLGLRVASHRLACVMRPANWLPGAGLRRF
jgi:hypothetical protein